MKLSTIRDWTLKQLSEHDEVVVVEPRGDTFIEIQRKKYEPISAAILNEGRVDRGIVESVFDQGVDVQFVANVPKVSVWTGDAIVVAREHNSGWGGLGDLMSAINLESVEGFQRNEYSFVERGIHQHNKVESFERLFDRVFLLFRKGLPEIKVALANEYELTAEHVRTAREVYGEFSLLVQTNPNGNVSSKAQEVAKGLGVDVLNWSDFYGRLNRA